MKNRTKLSLANIQDLLSREEMKRIMAGSGVGEGTSCSSCYAQGTSYSCEYSEIRGKGVCTCSAGNNDGTGCKLQ